MSELTEKKPESTEEPMKEDDTSLTPSKFLHTILGRPVSVSLSTSTEYKGILSCLDGYMNIAMEQCEEYEGGQLKSKFGDVFIRGNNVMYIATEKKMK
ncbi:hypothetical protein TL16_g07687 [Triparma laevis f. inornata]|uniref:Sm domain-containing protein n=2 Tax=Triparma laevis TaxID=1534972 RepID=A0A9W7KUI5_9STRA|nr:hypothetical protein TL16_g07687 [Triparma laevis f. inornata]GMI12152.1 hypothetical protein TrLO_g5971 [Triparma laevis f. longispina]